MRCSESLPLIPFHLVAFDPRYRVDTCLFAPRGGPGVASRPRGRVHVYRREPLSPAVLTRKRQGLLGSWGILCERALFSDSAGAAGPSQFGPSDAAFRSTHVVGHRKHGLISELHPTAHSLAVYASQRGLLQRHARLATGCWLDFAGQVYLLLNPNERFQPGIASSSPKLSQRTRSGTRGNEEAQRTTSPQRREKVSPISRRPVKG